MLGYFELLKYRQEALFGMREFFKERGFFEVMTPTLVENPGSEPNLDYFETEFVPSMGQLTQRQKLFLPTSPELHLKKALAKCNQDSVKIFELAHAFRNGECSREHEPEFLMLEWYEMPATLLSLSRTLEDLISNLHQRLDSKIELFRKDLFLDDVFEQELGKSYAFLRSNGRLEEQFFDIFLNEVEPEIRNERGLVFLWNFPEEFSALSTSHPDRKGVCERFELYIQGLELANAFQEELRENSVRKRFETDRKERLSLKKAVAPSDEEFINSCASIADRSVAGVAVGWDRLLQALAGAETLKDIRLFTFQEQQRQRFADGGQLEAVADPYNQEGNDH